MSKQRKLMTGAVTAIIIVIIVGASVYYFWHLQPAAPETIKIGVVDYTDIPTGRDPVIAAQLAAEEINAQGGVLGRQLEIVWGNNRNDITETSSIVQRMITVDKVVGIIGPVMAECTFAAQEICMDNKVIFFTSQPVDAVCTKVAQDYNRYKYTFRTLNNVTTFTRNYLYNWRFIVENYLIPRYGEARLAVVMEAEKAYDFPYTLLTQNLSLYFPPQTKIVYSCRYPITTTDFTSILHSIKDSGANGVVLGITYSEAIIFAKQYRELGLKAIAGGTVTPAQSIHWYNQTEGAGEYFFTNTNVLPIGHTPKNLPFINKFRERVGDEPTFTGTGAYDAVYILAAAIERAGSLDPDAIVAELEKTDYLGVSYRIVFTSTHDLMVGEDYYKNEPVQYAYSHLIQWQDAKRVLVYPVKKPVWATTWATSPIAIPSE